MKFAGVCARDGGRRPRGRTSAAPSSSSKASSGGGSGKFTLDVKLKSKKISGKARQESRSAGPLPENVTRQEFLDAQNSARSENFDESIGFDMDEIDEIASEAGVTSMPTFHVYR